MRRLLLLIALIPPMALATAGCSSTGTGDTSIDVMFRKTEVVDEDILELTTPALVNEINGAYEIEGIGYMPGAKLGSSGEVESGENRVFVLRFIDLGDISVLRTDDKQVSLRAEFGPEGKVVNALLGSPSGAVSDAFVSSGNDVFESGTWEVMYDGPELVVGRFDLKFRKYRVAGNFRAPRLR
jgi:hypothetical protein